MFKTINTTSMDEIQRELNDLEKDYVVKILKYKPLVSGTSIYHNIIIEYTSKAVRR